MDDAPDGLLMVNTNGDSPSPSSPEACLDQIATICRTFRLDALRPQIDACGEALKGGDSVDVEVPDLEPYQGIRFVDTPGLGSVFAHNTQTAMDWLP